MKGNSTSMNYVVPCPNPNINAHFTIYYKPGCGYSMSALKLLKEYRGKNNKQLLYTAYNVMPLIENVKKEKHLASYEAAKEHFFKKFDKLTGTNHRTFPLVFVNAGGKVVYLGGYTELANYLG